MTFMWFHGAAGILALVVNNVMVLFIHDLFRWARK